MWKSGRITSDALYFDEQKNDWSPITVLLPPSALRPQQTLLERAKGELNRIKEELAKQPRKTPEEIKKEGYRFTRKFLKYALIVFVPVALFGGGMLIQGIGGYTAQEVTGYSPRVDTFKRVNGRPTVTLEAQIAYHQSTQYENTTMVLLGSFLCFPALASIVFIIATRKKV